MGTIQTQTCLFGAIAGDMIGSRHEWTACTDPQFVLFSKSSKFTDDSVLTIAVADAILSQRRYGEVIVEYARRYPKAGYGGYFRRWIKEDGVEPYNSFGNGSAMRVSPVAWAFNSIEDVLHEAERSASVTHNHPEGIKGAQSIALAIYLARTGVEKEEIRREIETRFGYDLRRSLDAIRPSYQWDSTCFDLAELSKESGSLVKKVVFRGEEKAEQEFEVTCQHCGRKFKFTVKGEDNSKA